jgi:hypothetical protein
MNQKRIMNGNLGLFTLVCMIRGATKRNMYAMRVYNCWQLVLDDQVKYCSLTIDIYQKPIIAKEVIANFDYVSDVKPNFFIRVWDSIVQGWWILCEVLIFLIKLWGIALLITGLIFGIKYLSGLYKKMK